MGVAVETPVARTVPSSLLLATKGKDTNVIDTGKGSFCTVPVTGTFTSAAPELVCETLPLNVPAVVLLSRTATVLLEIVPETGVILRGPADQVVPASSEI